MRIRHFLRSFVPTLALAALPVASFAGIAVGVSITLAPPALPVYVQPAPPGADYIWTPGYWAWGDDDYYWVPGTWVLAPTPGFLWTPGYWGWDSGVYLWHGGYWGPHVGFYGGVNYGFGYGGVGFEGAYWRSGHVIYNRSVTNVTNINVTNVYNKTVVVNNVNHVSFNGGSGGLTARPNARELAAVHDRHVEATSMQREHVQMAAGNHDLRAHVNGGRPQIAATERPNAFSGRGVVAARAAGGPVHAGGAGPHSGGGAGPGADHDGPDHGSPASAHPGPEHGPGSAHVAAGPRADRPPNAFHANGAGEAHGGPTGGPGSANESHGTAHVDHAPAAPHPDRGAGPAQRAEHAQPGPHLASAPHVDRPVNHEPPHAPAPHPQPQPQVEHHAGPAGGAGPGAGNPHAGGPAAGTRPSGGPPHPGGPGGGGGEHPGGGHPQAHEGGHGPNGGGGREEHR